MTLAEILKELHTEATKPLDFSTPFEEGLSRGKQEAYAHAWFLLKNIQLGEPIDFSKLKPHQKEAVLKWVQNKGLLNVPVGVGKK